MALFGSKKDSEGKPQASKAPSTGGEDDKPQINPEKAKAFFDRARTVHEATNYEFAMLLWLNGLRLDPSNLAALEGFWKSAVAFDNEQGKLSKDMRKSFPGGKSDVEKYLSELLEWGVDPVEAIHPVRAMEAVAKIHASGQADMVQIGRWIAERAYPLIGREKPKKDHYVKLMNATESLGLFDIAVRSGDSASRLDPSDSELSSRTRNLAAQATMSTGGYDRTGQEGGFRANIRDAEKQRRLDEQDRVVKTEDVKDRAVADTERDYMERPTEVYTINAYVKALLERGRPEDEKQAYTVLLKSFEATKQFHLRQKAGEIRLRQARRRLDDYLLRAEQNPQDETAQMQARMAQRKFTEMELEEYRLRVANYPTDLSLKFELGKREFDLDHFEEAIALFQEAQHDPRNRTVSLTYLGQAFAKMGWLDEAIDTLRKALEQHADPDDAQGMELRYALMNVLQLKAAQDRDAQAAQEAEKLASGIAIRQISYRDIRERRDTLKKLVAELRQPS